MLCFSSSALPFKLPAEVKGTTRYNSCKCIYTQPYTRMQVEYTNRFLMSQRTRPWTREVIHNTQLLPHTIHKVRCYRPGEIFLYCTLRIWRNVNYYYYYCELHCCVIMNLWNIYGWGWYWHVWGKMWEWFCQLMEKLWFF